MKKIVTLGIFVLGMLAVNAQKLDYDNDSKWFLGLNAGATWSTTDVKNKTYAGWGLTFGRAFNYNYGKKISFDLRFRYLGGKWFGQDYDTTSLVNYNSNFAPGNVVQLYDTLGYTINNFETKAHELGLELVIHANGLRERTGWDPYIFGGANIVFNQTRGNLLYEDSIFGENYLYNYPETGMTKTQWKEVSDGEYDLTLDGSNPNRFNADFMPSLGVGLAYQVGPRFSIGIEHKTTFALKDVFDGYEDPSLRAGLFENDIYHYTSASLKFHFRKGRGGSGSGGSGTGGSSNSNSFNNNNDCLEPEIRLIQPNKGTVTVYEQYININAEVKRVASRNNISFQVNGNSSTNFVYNENNKKFAAGLYLNPGNNTIVIKAGNGCGSEQEVLTINYVNCKAPLIDFISPSAVGINVDDQGFLVRAKIAGSSQLQYVVNGVPSSNYVFASIQGDFSSQLNLVEGENRIKIIATNDCGTVERETVVNYTKCANPFINVLVNSNTVMVDEPIFNLSAVISNVSGSQDIGYRLNGVNGSFNFNANTKKFTTTIALNEGNNTIDITALNKCGVDGKSITIVYTPCVKPTISITHPAPGYITASDHSEVRALINNVTSANQIQLWVNGQLDQSSAFSTATMQYENTVSLNIGINTIKLKASTPCGNVTKTITIRRDRLGIDVPNEEKKVTICHYPPGNTDNPQQLEIPLSAWPAHQAHGDKLGPCPEVEEPVEEEKVTICHYPPGNTDNPQQLEIPLSAWPAHQAHGDKLGPCPEVEEPIEEEKVTICHYPPGNTDNPQQLEIPLSAWPAHQAHGDKLGPCPEVEEPVEEEKVTICHYPPGNTDNPQQLEIPLSAWPAHQAHGDKLGPCPEVEEPVEEEKVTICHYPPGNTDNPQQLEIPLSAWPAHQAHGDKLGPCPEVEEPVEEKKITICHYPPGNTDNPQQLEIPLSAWPAHQAHGDKLGPCPEVEEPVEEEKVTICHYPPGNTDNPQQLEIPLSAWPAHQAHGDKLGPCPEVEEPVEEEKVTICHYPPGNTDNPQQLEIPLSAWPAHQAHGDKLGPCPEVEEPVEEKKITICHYPPGNTDNPQQLEIPLSAWPAHQAHGDKLGPCPEVEEEKITICVMLNNGKRKTMQIKLADWPKYQRKGAKLGNCIEEREPVKPPSTEHKPDKKESERKKRDAEETIRKAKEAAAKEKIRKEEEEQKAKEPTPVKPSRTP